MQCARAFGNPYNQMRASADPSAWMCVNSFRAITPPSANNQRLGKCWTMARFRFQIRTLMNVIAAVAVLMASRHFLLPRRVQVTLEAGFATLVVSFALYAAPFLLYSLIAATVHFFALVVSRCASRSQARLTTKSALDQLGSEQNERAEQHDDAASHTSAVSRSVPNRGNV